MINLDILEEKIKQRELKKAKKRRVAASLSRESKHFASVRRPAKLRAKIKVKIK
jgi:hypothetical protein